MRIIQDAFHPSFWKENPALLYALFFLLGIAFKVSFHPVLFMLLIPLMISCRKRSLLGALFFLLAFFYAPRDHDLQSPEKISGIFHPTKISRYRSHFKSGITYEGSLITDKGKFPTRTYFKGKKRVKGDVLVKGVLKKNGPYRYSLKPTKFQEIKSGFSLPFFRYSLKKEAKRYIKKHTSKDSGDLFGALFLGELQNKRMRYAFQKLGLSHLLAISGFHFALISCLIFFLTRCFFARMTSLYLLLFLTSCYVFFLGFSASIFRAYIVLFFLVIGEIFGKKTSIYNLLGTSALIEMIISPPIILNIGFQLSFISCFSLLFFARFLELGLFIIFPKRSVRDIKNLNLFSQNAHLFGAFFRKALAITLSVNLAIIPLLLFYFHTFPLIGLLYNLFIPPLIALCALLFFLSLPFPFLLKYLSYFSDAVLKIIYYPPPFSSISIIFKTFPFAPTFIYVTFLFFLGIYLQKKNRLEMA